MDFKDWPKKKIDTLIRIYPYYSDKQLSEIVGCTIQEIEEFHKAFPRITKEQARKKSDRPKTPKAGNKFALMTGTVRNRFYIKNEGDDYFLYRNEEVLFRTCSRERMMKYIADKKITLDHS